VIEQLNPSKNTSFLKTQRLIGYATGAFGAAVILVTVGLGYIVLRLAQIGPQAEQALDRLIPFLMVGLACEVFLIILTAFFVANFLAEKLAGSLNCLEREIDSALQKGEIRPLHVEAGDAMEGMTSRLNAVLDLVSRQKISVVSQEVRSKSA